MIDISIHAPARGATRSVPQTRHRENYFNPRTREGCDLSEAYGDTASRISIHAPARGATLNSVGGFAISLFQSTHPRGVRLAKYGVCHKRYVFQSTHPRGVRRKGASLLDFTFLISIHAPARGATNGVSSIVPTFKISIHAPARGATS